MFRALFRPSSGAYNCFSSVVGRGLVDHDQQRCCRHYPTVKPEAAKAVVSS